LSVGTSWGLDIGVEDGPVHGCVNNPGGDEAVAPEGIEKLKLAAEEAGYSTELRPSAVLGNILKALGL
jgi:hypothetical protein